MTDSYIAILNDVIAKISLYVPYVTIILGTLGGLCNLLTFTSKQLHRNPCAFYFLCSAVFDLFTLLICAILRLVVDHYAYVLQDQTIVFCKIRTYLTAVLPGLSTCCIVLASVDRCMITSSSTRLRNWSSMKVAYRLVAISVIYWLISPAHMLVFYGFYTINGVPNTCSSLPGVYSVFVSIFFIVWLTLIPYVIMVIASTITLIHIRASGNRVVALQQQTNVRRRIERHLIIMMFIQVNLSVILLSMRTVLIGYSLLTRTVAKDSLSRSIESFFSQFSVVLYYINYAKSFFLYTLTSPLFREVFIRRVTQLKNLIQHPTRDVAMVQLTNVNTTNKRVNVAASNE